MVLRSLVIFLSDCFEDFHLAFLEYPQQQKTFISIDKIFSCNGILAFFFTTCIQNTIEKTELKNEEREREREREIERDCLQNFEKPKKR